jgi:hypothetical protein
MSVVRHHKDTIMDGLAQEISCCDRDDVSQFALYIAEDDGEVDWDFPCLDPKETVAKFGFSYLALVHRGVGQAAQFGAPTMSMPLSEKDGPSLAERYIFMCPFLTIKYYNIFVFLRDEIEIGGAVDQALKLHGKSLLNQYIISYYI